MTATRFSDRNLLRATSRIVSAFTLLAALVACSKGSDQKADSAPPKVAAAPDSGAVRPLCPEDGRWNECVLLDRLVHAGVAPVADSTDTTRVAYLTPPGVHYRIGRSSQLIAFYFGDSVSARTAWKALDSVRFVPKSDTANPWPARPNSIRSGNLVAVFFSEKPEQVERVLRVFAAGLPAPAK